MLHVFFFPLRKCKLRSRCLLNIPDVMYPASRVDGAGRGANTFDAVEGSTEEGGAWRLAAGTCLPPNNSVPVLCCVFVGRHRTRRRSHVFFFFALN